MQFNASKKEWIPTVYQKDGVKWLTSRPAGALFWAPGLGKTTTVFTAFQNLRKRKLAKRILIVASLRVCQGVWRQEQDKWLGFDDFTIGFAHGPGKEAILKDQRFDMVLLNYDGLLWATSKLVDGDFDIICFDELTRMKHTNTQRFKRTKKILSYFKFRWGLTGTPVPNGIMDLFGQVFILDGGQRLGPYITKYRFTFFHQKPWDKWTWFPNQGAVEEITRRISNLANYVDEKEWNKMPKLMDVPIKVTLPKNAAKQYKTLEDLFILKLEKDIVTAANAAVLSLKLRQAASGSVYDQDGNPIHIHSEKLDALEDLVEEMAGDPLIVAVGFLHEVEAIRAKLGFINGKEIPYLGGGVTHVQMDKILTQWNMGWIPVLLAHPTSVAHGLNLQSGGRALCWYSLTFNSEEYTQLIRRVYRKGQTRTVLNYHIIAQDTIDKHVFEVLTKKERVQQDLLSGLKAYYGVSHIKT